MTRPMQSEQIPPDVTIGYGTDPRESGSHVVGLVFLALVVAVVVYLVRQWKVRKR